MKYITVTHGLRNEMHIWLKRLRTCVSAMRQILSWNHVQETRSKEEVWVKQPVEPLVLFLLYRNASFTRDGRVQKYVSQVLIKYPPVGVASAGSLSVLSVIRVADVSIAKVRSPQVIWPGFRTAV